MKRINVPRKSVFNRILTQGESIEEKVRRIVDNNEPIEDTAPMIYTERKNGVQQEYNIRADKWDIAQNAMQQVNDSKKRMIANKIAKSDGVNNNVENADKKTINENPNLN